jgi:hypothetical protein
MPANGNMKPDSRMLGRKNIIDICIACSWFCTMVEKVQPIARLVVMNSVESSASSIRLPWTGTPNSSTPMPMISVAWMKPTST